jgi:hypothetical protein
LTILVIIFIEDSRSERGREFSRDCLPGFGMRSRSALRYCLGRIAHLRQALVRAVNAAIVACWQWLMSRAETPDSPGHEWGETDRDVARKESVDTGWVMEGISAKLSR